MAGYREPTPEELEESRDARIARRNLDKMEVGVNYLEHAARLVTDSNQVADETLGRLITETQKKCLQLKGSCSGRVESRRRPRSNPSGRRCTVFLDECGQHAVAAHDPFPVFVLAAAIIADDDYPTVDAKWKQWKQDRLGSDSTIIHEPDIRRRRHPFGGDDGEAVVADLHQVVGELKFAGLAVVIHRADYIADYGAGPIDVSLPAHAYMLALDFLMERIVFALDTQFDGARARTVAESRGRKEDAQLQHEFARLHLDGTSYVHPSWFRQQLHPGIEFLDKRDNHTGLQLADLLARPIGEKVADPTSEPPRWSLFRDKLCSGQETKHSSIGLKVVPWRERYQGLEKS